MEKVSVIIPTYNREKTILRALNSVLDQTYTNIEVLVVDDGSTDGTADIVNGVKDKRVKYIVLEKNGGASNARNVGVQMAESKWIAFQDSDDSWRKDKLEVQMAYAKEHPEYSLIYCMYKAFLQNGEEFIVPPKPWPVIMEGNMMSSLLDTNVIGTPTMLVKRERFLETGGFDVSYHALEDWEFVIRFARDHQIGFVDKVLMDVYTSESRITANFGAYYEARCKMLGQYKNVMAQEGILEEVMLDILTRAQRVGVEDMVKKMMMMYLVQ